MVPIPQEWVAETISKYEVQVVYAADSQSSVLTTWHENLSARFPTSAHLSFHIPTIVTSLLWFSLSDFPQHFEHSV